MAKSKILGENFFGLNRFRIFETCFKTKISKLKKKSVTKFFLGLRHFLLKMAKIVKNGKVKTFWSKKIFGRNWFRMLWNENLEIESFSRYNFLSWDLVIFAQNSQNGEKWQYQKFIKFRNVFLVLKADYFLNVTPTPTYD